MTAGIYKITCKHEKILYIGSSKNIEERWVQHKSKLNRETHHNNKLQTSWDAYGSDNFVFYIVEATDNLSQREQHWLNLYWPDCYNASKYANNVMANIEVATKQVESLKQSGLRGKQKLTEPDVIEIKLHLLNKTATIKELVDIFGVSTSTIYAIKLGTRWGHVKVEGFVSGTNKKHTDNAEAIVKDYNEGMLVVKIAEKWNIPSTATVYDILNRQNIGTNRYECNKK